MNNKLIIENLFDKYNLSKDDRKRLIEIIKPIYSHYEFQRRLTDEFLHHSDITLGEHIIEDAIMTYILSKKKTFLNYRVDLAIKIAMLHDLYTIPWQNNELAKVKHFFNKHGFRHPVEAVINSINWYPALFDNEADSVIIIDGILHHMFPLPVRNLKGDLELANQDLFNKLSNSQKKIIESSLKRKTIGLISISRSKYKEGRIMSKADKKVSRKQIKNFASAKSLLTGHNKSINKNK